MLTPNSPIQRSPLLVQVLGFALAVLVALYLLSPRAAEPGRTRSPGPVRALQEDRLATLQRLEALMNAKYQAGQGSPAGLWTATQATAEAELDLCATPKERVAVLEGLVQKARSRESDLAQRAQNKLVGEETVLQAKADRLQAEIRLAQTRGAAFASSQ